jgi:hypothetical protein
MNSPLKPHGTIHGLIAGLVNHKNTRFGKGSLGPLPLAVNLEKKINLRHFSTEVWQPCVGQHSSYTNLTDSNGYEVLDLKKGLYQGWEGSSSGRVPV